MKWQPIETAPTDGTAVLLLIDDGEWISLDDAARANLRGADLSEFFRYRDRLRDEAHQWTGDAEEILTGFIWDNSEE